MTGLRGEHLANHEDVGTGKGGDEGDSIEVAGMVGDDHRRPALARRSVPYDSDGGRR